MNKDFHYCHAKTIVSSENRYYRSDKACVYRINGDGSEELMYCFKPGIMNFEVPKCVVSINENAFMGCKNLVNIVMNEGLKFIGKNAFNDCSIKKVYIPDTVEYLGNLPLKQDKHNNPIKIVFSSENKHFFFENDILYQYIDGGYKLICCRSVKNTVEVKEGTLTIGEGAFSLCRNLKKVLIPYTLKELERESFKSCRKLRTVTINDEEHRNLNNVICLPDAVKRIEVQTFAFTGFRSLSFSDNIEFIGEHAFCYCSSLKNVRLPKNLIVLSYEQTTPELYESEEVTDENRWMVNDDDIGKNAFSECCKLRKVNKV